VVSNRGHGAIGLRRQEHDLSAAEDDAPGALLDQPVAEHLDCQLQRAVRPGEELDEGEHADEVRAVHLAAQPAQRLGPVPASSPSPTSTRP
jgi:hypothetical protein